MDTKNAEQRMAQQLGHEHREICATLSLIEELIARHAEHLDSGAPGRLPALLRKLGALLLDHFRYEEKSLMFTDCPQDFPHLRAALDGLLTEHGEIMMRIRHIHASFESVESNHGPMDIVRDTHELMRIIRRHEKFESEILRNVYTDSNDQTSVGVGD